MDSLFSVHQKTLTFLTWANCPNWICWFERFRLAAELDKKDDDYQVNPLVYAMVNIADHILSMLGLSAEDDQVPLINT